MPLYFTKIGKDTELHIPPRFRISEITMRNYVDLMTIFRTVFQKSGLIMKAIDEQNNQSESEISLKARLIKLKQLVMSYRRKYVFATWLPKETERLHNEMTADISSLLKENDDIGALWRQVKALRK